MHVQPEARSIRVSDRPLWASGAIDRVAAFVARRPRPVRVLEFGSGGSSIFLLELGVTLTTVEHHEAWAPAVRHAAEKRGLASNLRLLLRRRPYDSVVEEVREEGPFDAVIVDGRDRVACLTSARGLLRDDGILVLDDSQRRRYWPAHEALCAVPSETFVDADRSTTIWHPASAAERSLFVRKRFYSTVPHGDELQPDEICVPRDFIGRRLTPGYLLHRPIEARTPLERRLQKLGYIGDRATYSAPRTVSLQRARVRITEGRKYLLADGATFVSRGGRLVRSDREDVFQVDAVPLEGLTLDLTSPGAARYAFFLLDALPKVEVVRATGGPLSRFDHILVNSGAAWLKDALIRETRVDPSTIVAPSGSAPSFELHESEHVEGVRFHRFTPEWVRQFVAGLVETRPPPRNPASGARVFISRQRASGRRIENYDEFKAILSRLGFVEIHAEDYGLNAIADIMSKASIVVAPHGAGLSNILFCRENTVVVELFASHYTPQYKYLSDELGLRYVPFLCNDPEGQNVITRASASGVTAEYNRLDLVVPCEAFAAFAADLLRGKRPRRSIVHVIRSTLSRVRSARAARR